MNILADRHHAGLYNSLTLLFERRLGWHLYTPVGLDWWEQGFWNFGRKAYGDDRLARQFLNHAEYAIDAWHDAFYVGQDPEFPDDDIYGVTLEQARNMRWDVVLATVDDNQRGFEHYAQITGAKYAVHVGNTNQFVDWTLAPYALNASEMPMRHDFVDIGEEFDSARMFAYQPPDGTKLISSFVNCMTSIACYPLLQEAQAILPEWSFHTHGIDGPDEVLKPISLVANEMARASFGWHDKEHGDGFGHVLHYWAAIGRPLIGHASHYAGKNGHVFWRDLETCIDLDRRSMGEAATLINEIVNDPPRHEAMCRAIRAVFDANTDWAGDAERVRGLLG